MRGYLGNQGRNRPNKGPRHGGGGQHRDRDSRIGYECRSCPAQAGVLGYYRFPAIHNDAIVFTAEGDLWRVGLNGGTAQRLTTHPAEESRPAFSPDGRTIAFSAAYEGPTEVHRMTIARRILASVK